METTSLIESNCGGKVMMGWVFLWRISTESDEFSMDGRCVLLGQLLCRPALLFLSYNHLMCFAKLAGALFKELPGLHFNHFSRSGVLESVTERTIELKMGSLTSLETSFIWRSARMTARKAYVNQKGDSKEEFINRFRSNIKSCDGSKSDKSIENGNWKQVEKENPFRFPPSPPASQSGGA